MNFSFKSAFLSLFLTFVFLSLQSKAEVSLVAGPDNVVIGSAVAVAWNRTDPGWNQTDFIALYSSHAFVGVDPPLQTFNTNRRSGVLRVVLNEIGGFLFRYLDAENHVLATSNSTNVTYVTLAISGSILPVNFPFQITFNASEFLWSSVDWVGIYTTGSSPVLVSEFPTQTMSRTQNVTISITGSFVAKYFINDFTFLQSSDVFMVSNQFGASLSVNSSSNLAYDNLIRISYSSIWSPGDWIGAFQIGSSVPVVTFAISNTDGQTKNGIKSGDYTVSINSTGIFTVQYFSNAANSFIATSSPIALIQPGTLAIVPLSIQLGQSMAFYWNCEGDDWCKVFNWVAILKDKPGVNFRTPTENYRNGYLLTWFWAPFTNQSRLLTAGQLNTVGSYFVIYYYWDNSIAQVTEISIEPV